MNEVRVRHIVSIYLPVLGAGKQDRICREITSCLSQPKAAENGIDVRSARILIARILELLRGLRLRGGRGQHEATGAPQPCPLVPPLIAAVLIMLTFVTFPPGPKDIGMDGDVSLAAVLNYAHAQGIQFGPELVFTYGPLGFLIMFYFSPHLWALRMVVDTVLCLTVASGLCLAAWRLRPWWRYPLLILFVFAAANLDPRSDLVLETGLLCWGLLCFLESGARLKWCIEVFCALTAFAALAKVSFLVVGAASILLVALDLLLRGERRLALMVSAGFCGLWLLGWVAAGQNLGNIPAFLSRSLALVKAYNQALGWEGLPILRLSGLVLGVLVFAGLGLRSLTAFESSSAAVRWRRPILMAWLALLTFTAWKHSFFREDFRHPPFFMAFGIVLVLALEAVPSAWQSGRWLARALAVLCCLFGIVSLQTLYFPNLARSAKQPFRSFAANAAHLLRPGQYHSQMLEATAVCQRDGQLPELKKLIDHAGVDCFGYTQVYLLYNDLDYQPRPVFQSYVAGNERLMRWNEQWYLTNSAPEFVLFALNAVDRRFPVLEDARVLRTVLFNYQPIAAEGDFLLLKQKSSDLPRLELLAKGTVRAGEAINLSQYAEADLWLEIEMAPSFVGRVRQIVFQPPTVRLAAWREPGKGLLLRRRAPAAMLAAGFVASPLISNTRDVLNLYADKDIIHPGAYSIELKPGEEYLWDQRIRYRIFRINNTLGRCLPAEFHGQLRQH